MSEAASTFISVFPSNADLAEGDSGTTPFVFTATRSGDTSMEQTIAYTVRGSGLHPADAGDFAGHVLPAGTLSFAADETFKMITVNVAGDTTPESDEGFTVTLSNPPAGVAIETASATGTILNDDAPPQVVTHDDSYVVIQNHSLNVAMTGSVLVNDLGSPTIVSLVNGPTHGAFQLAGDGTFSYTPDPGFNGIDGFTYNASNGGSSSSSQAVLFVTPVIVGASTTLDLLTLNAPEQIAATYVAFFGRAADAGGFNFWVNEFNVNLPTQGGANLFANIASSFGVSAEAKALYPFLANPFGASDSQITSFLDTVYNNMFNRGSDAAGLAYWTGQVKATLAAGQFVGSVLVNIMSGAQDTADGHDITTLVEQKHNGYAWTTEHDGASATALLHSVTSDQATVLVGMAQAHALVVGHP